jgi:hypothetical protein
MLSAVDAPLMAIRPRLHVLGDFPDQLDLQQAVVEGRALHLHIVRQAEPAI